MNFFCTATSFQLFNSMDRIIFMQGGAPLHIPNPVKQQLKRHFGNARIIRYHFPIDLPSWSPDFHPSDFWLWGYLKDVVFNTPIVHLAELKGRIAQHILNVTSETPRSVVEHVVQGLAENGGQYVEHVLHQSLEIWKPIWWMLFMRFFFSPRTTKNRYDECFLCGIWPQDS